MQFYTIFIFFLASLAVAAPTSDLVSRQTGQKPPVVGNGGSSNSSGILQFEIDKDTFTSNTRISIPGKLSFKDRPRPLTVIAAGVVSPQGIANPELIDCRAYGASGNEIGQFGYGNPKTMAKGQKITIEEISCNLRASRLRRI